MWRISGVGHLVLGHLCRRRHMLPNPEEPEVFAANCVWKEIEVTRVGELNMKQMQADWSVNPGRQGQEQETRAHRWHMSKSLIWKLFGFAELSVLDFWISQFQTVDFEIDHLQIV